MANSLKELRKKSSLEELTKAVDALSGNYQKSEIEENFWKPTADKAGNGSAIIRFLPAPEGEDAPFIRSFTHGFQGPSDKWFIGNCPTTIASGTPCPVCEMNNALWEGTIDGISQEDGRAIVSGGIKDKKQRSGSKRKKSYISNILVIKDAAHPENEGKVFKFSYGQKIFDKITTAMRGDEGTDTAPIEVFNPWEGANFKLKFGNSDGQRSYDASVFDHPSPIGTDEEIEAIWKKEYSLKAFLAPEHFKSYEDMQKQLLFVIKNVVGKSKTVTETKPVLEAEEAPSIKSESSPIDRKKTIAEVDGDDEDFEKYLDTLE